MGTGAAVAGSLRESWFWAGVFRDHAAFIHDNLAPGQERPIGWAARFRQDSAALHAEAETLARAAGSAVPARAAERLGGVLLTALGGLREFKEELLQQKLDCQVQLNLPPTLLQHMLNEAAEADRVLGPALAGVELAPPLAALHQHLIWLPDAAGHAALLHSGLDAVEMPLQATTQQFKQVFDGMHIKALELYSMLRVAPRMIGALRRLNQDAVAQIAVFRGFLTELREHLAGCTVLGTLVPLLADHMLREELYYTEKLLQLEQ